MNDALKAILQLLSFLRSLLDKMLLSSFTFTHGSHPAITSVANANKMTKIGLPTQRTFRK